MIKIIRKNKQSNQNLNEQIKTKLQELEKDLLKMKNELDKKSKQINQYDKKRIPKTCCCKQIN